MELLKKAYYRSTKRGCKESDYVLKKFVDRHLHNMSEEELKIYSDFLDEEDYKIMYWIMGKELCPLKYNHILKLITDTIDE